MRIAIAASLLLLNACGARRGGPPAGYAIWRGVQDAQSGQTITAERDPPPILIPPEVEPWWAEEDTACPSGAVLVGAAPPAGSAIGCVVGEEVKEGRWAVWSDGGHTFTQSEHLNGQAHGATVAWQWADQKWKKVSEQQFSAGKRHGPTRVIRAGVVIIEGEYRDGKDYGRWIMRHENGQLAAQIEMGDSQTGGQFLEWHENGQQKSETRYLAGKKHGRQVEWFPNGQLESEEEYIEGMRHGPASSWHENGQQACTGTWLHGVQDGVQVCWHSNGQRQSEKAYAAGEKVGVWMTWHDNGTMKSRAGYEDGQPVGDHETWDEAGTRRSLVEYRGGVRHGPAQVRDRDGDLLKEETWDQGRLVSSQLTDCENRVQEAEARFRAVAHTYDLPPPPDVELPLVEQEVWPRPRGSAHRLVIHDALIELDGEPYDRLKSDELTAALAAIAQTAPAHDNEPGHRRGPSLLQIWTTPDTPLEELTTLIRNALVGRWYLSLVVQEANAPPQAPRLAAPDGVEDAVARLTRLFESDEIEGRRLYETTFAEAAGRCEALQLGARRAVDALSRDRAFAVFHFAAGARDCGCKGIDLDTLEHLTVLWNARYDEPYFGLVPLQLPLPEQIAKQLATNASVADWVAAAMSADGNRSREW